MTDRLYYTDPFVRSFEATVDSAIERDGRTVVFLDRTAFYPTSGGQPFDTGTLGGARVVDVIDEEDGRVAHILEHPAAQHPAPGTRRSHPR
jgi:Predicted metal-dependent hydrolases related to alanyl-tRNA synthetase HxxxH domain